MTPRKTNDLKALRNMISEAHKVIATTNLPESRSERVYELLTAALHLADHLVSVSPAAELGKKGGTKTAERGPEYYAQIAAMRKTRAGGRPKKQQQSPA